MAQRSGSSWNPPNGRTSGYAYFDYILGSEVAFAANSGITTGDANAQFAISVWFKIEQDGRESTIFTQNEGGAGNGFNVRVDDGQLIYGIGANITMIYPDIRDDQWHHLVLARNIDAEIEVWLDGARVDDGEAFPWAIPANSTPVLGKWTSSSPNWFSGWMSDFRIYNGVTPTATQVRALRNPNEEPSGMGYPDLHALYNTLGDRSQNNVAHSPINMTFTGGGSGGTPATAVPVLAYWSGEIDEPEYPKINGQLVSVNTPGTAIEIGAIYDGSIDYDYGIEAETGFFTEVEQVVIESGTAAGMAISNNTNATQAYPSGFGPITLTETGGTGQMVLRVECRTAPP